MLLKFVTKNKELKEYKNKPTEELRKDLGGHSERLAKLKFDLAAGKVKNIREIRQIKKTIAQIMTAIREKNN